MNFNVIITRLDISKTISKLLEFLQNSSLTHLVVANQTLEYLIVTKFLAIEFNRNQQDKKIFITSSDLAFVDNSNTCYSSYRFCFLLYSRLIYYKAIKGTIVTTSSTKVELLALSTTTKNFIWQMRLFQNIQFDLEEELTIYCNNLQTIQLLTKETPKLQTTLKYIDIHQCQLQQEVQAKKIKVEQVRTLDIVVDGFTKLLLAQRHAKFLQQLNLVDIKDIFQKEMKSTRVVTN